jgi:hypothetical protein
LDFSAVGGKRQKHGSALIGAGLKIPNQIKNYDADAGGNF